MSDKSGDDSNRTELPGSAAAAAGPPPVRRVALIGNVCVGKTTLFERLSGGGGRAINIPGTTQSAQRGVLIVGAEAASRRMRKACTACGTGALFGGRAQRVTCCGDMSRQRGCPLAHDPGAGEFALTHVFDTPGSMSLAAGGEDEMVARDLVLSGLLDSVVVVADAKNLRRSLALVLELAEFGMPVNVDLNMLDEAEALGIDIDEGELSHMLGVPVSHSVAVENRGVRTLVEQLSSARPTTRRAKLPAIVEQGIAELEPVLRNPKMATRGLSLLLLSGDRAARQWIRQELGDAAAERAVAIVAAIAQATPFTLRKLIADALHAEAGQITERVVTQAKRGPSVLLRFGRAAQRPMTGLLIAAVVLIFAYYWVGVFGATFVVDTLKVEVFEAYVIPWCEQLVAPIPSAFVRDAIMDGNYGLLPTGLFLALGIVLPVLFCFFLLQAILEDSGYLPRLAVLLDRVFRKFGLNGQAVIPLVLGFSCVTMAIITTRMLPSRKERVLMTFLLILAVPCAPLLAVMLVILNKMPWSAAAVVFGTIGLQLLLGAYVASKLLKGQHADLIMEMPAMRVPRPRMIWSKTWRRTWQFMREALPIFLLASFAVFLFDRVHGLAGIERAARPVVQGLLGLPDKAVQVFIKTAIRRESGATELTNLRAHFDNVQVVVTLLVMTFLVPCINSAIVIVKERGLKTAAFILGAVALWAILAGAIVNAVLRGLQISFA